MAATLEPFARSLLRHCGKPYQIGYRSDSHRAKSGVNWDNTYGGGPAQYHLRAVSPGQICFDIGDDGDWAACREATMRLWRTLDAFEVSYIGSLSGGKGTHTELWGPIVPKAHCTDGVDWRISAARIIAELAGARIRYDRLLVAPNEGNRLVREFGARKGPLETKRKMPWAMPGRPWLPLPEDRDEAYRMAEARGVIYPDAVPVCDDLERFSMAWRKQAFSESCPKGATCLTEICESCPMAR